MKTGRQHVVIPGLATWSECTDPGSVARTSTTAPKGGQRAAFLCVSLRPTDPFFCMIYCMSLKNCVPPRAHANNQVNRKHNAPHNSLTRDSPQIQSLTRDRSTHACMTHIYLSSSPNLLPFANVLEAVDDTYERGDRHSQDLTIGMLSSGSHSDQSGGHCTSPADRSTSQATATPSPTWQLIRPAGSLSASAPVRTLHIALQALHCFAVPYQAPRQV